MEAHTCIVCLNAQKNRPFAVREMMFGTRDVFEYFECGQCGGIQAINQTIDVSRYYPSDYYAFQDGVDPEPEPLKIGPLKHYLLERRLRAKLGFPDVLGRLILQWREGPRLPDWLDGQRVDLRFSSPILDVGCGAGHMLKSLYCLGFDNLRGIDPFIRTSIDYGHGLQILKGNLEDVDGTFDLITFHHSLEHVTQPREYVLAAAKRLAPEGILLLRVPLAGTHAWRQYGVNWAQLDVPRHMFIPTERSIAVLAELAGLELKRVVHDSTGFLFWASEQYIRDIPLCDPRSAFNNPTYGTFTKSEMDVFDRRAQALNATRDGDQAAFYLQKPAAIKTGMV